MRTWRQKRKWIYGYAVTWMGKENVVKGFNPRSVLPFGKPARKQLLLDQKNLLARKLLAPYEVDGTWNTATDRIAFPPLSVGKRVIALAAKELGTVEVPFGSNRGKRVNYYQSSTGAYNTFWCASFCWKMWQEAGYKGAVSAGAWRSTDLIGTKVVLAASLQPGDLVSLNEGDGHIGLFVKHNAAAKTVTLIAGNTSNSVKEVDYPISLIHSMCRPQL
jgi:cell wall-associated NlpC family hydrolase